MKKIFVSLLGFFCVLSLLVVLSPSRYSSAGYAFSVRSTKSSLGGAIDRITRLGDINGDGYDDIAVIDNGHDSNNGIVYIHLGGSDLSDPDYTINGSGGERLGMNIFRLGHFNDDAYDDFMVFGRYSNSVKGYVYYGGETFNTVVDLTIESATVSMGDYFYIDPESDMVDFDIDGYTDIVLPYFNGATARADIYSGGVSPDATADDSISAPDSSVGGMMRSMRDFNGDGNDDMALLWINMGNYSITLNGYFASDPIDKTADLVLPFDASVLSLDNGPGSNFVNDINDDGNSDYVYMNASTLDIYFGGASISGSPDATISMNNDTQVNVSGTGDIDGDGVGDLIVSDYDSGLGSNALYVYYGSDSLSGSLSADMTFDPADYTDFDTPKVIGGDISGDFLLAEVAGMSMRALADSGGGDMVIYDPGYDSGSGGMAIINLEEDEPSPTPTPSPSPSPSPSVTASSSATATPTATPSSTSTVSSTSTPTATATSTVTTTVEAEATEDDTDDTGSSTATTGGSEATVTPTLTTTVQIIQLPEITELYDPASNQVFTVSPTGAVAIYTNRPTFRGFTIPDADVTVYVHSAEQIVGETQSDAVGKWEYTPDQDLSAGDHTVYIVVKSKLGQTQTSEKVAFEVTDNTDSGLDTTATSEQDLANPNYWLYLGILMAVGLIGFGLYRVLKK